MKFMKPLYFLITFFLLSFITVSSVYDISVTSLDGTTINLSSYRGKKILVYEFDGSSPDSSQLRYLDSLQRIDSLQVIAIPATDFGSSASLQDLNNLKDSL